MTRCLNTLVRSIVNFSCSSTVISFIYPCLTPFHLHRIFLSKWPKHLPCTCLFKKLPQCSPFCFWMLQTCLLCFLLEPETIFKGHVPWNLVRQDHMKLSDSCLPKPKYSVTTEDYLVTSYFWTVALTGLGLLFVIGDVSLIQVSMGVLEGSIITCRFIFCILSLNNIIQSTFILTCLHFICLEFSPRIKM